MKLKNFFLLNTGYTYSNLSRLFLRIFTAVMLLQIAMQQMMNTPNIVPTIEGLLGLSPKATLIVMITLELICATFILLGLLTRIVVIPMLVIMCYAESFIMKVPAGGTSDMFMFSPGYPVMFIGIFIFMLLAGPGKISLDYLIAVHLDRPKHEDEILENA